ncbi:recombinase family protein [Weissella confusa]
MIYGYARVSSQGQDFNGQVAALKKFGATKIITKSLRGLRLIDQR